MYIHYIVFSCIHKGLQLLCTADSTSLNHPKTHPPLIRLAGGFFEAVPLPFCHAYVVHVIRMYIKSTMLYTYKVYVDIDNGQWTQSSLGFHVAEPSSLPRKLIWL